MVQDFDTGESRARLIRGALHVIASKLIRTLINVGILIRARESYGFAIYKWGKIIFIFEVLRTSIIINVRHIQWTEDATSALNGQYFSFYYQFLLKLLIPSFIFWNKNISVSIKINNTDKFFKIKINKTIWILQQFVQSNLYSDFSYSHEYFLLWLIYARSKLRKEIASGHSIYRLRVSASSALSLKSNMEEVRLRVFPSHQPPLSFSSSSFFSRQSPLLDATRTQRDHWRTYGRTAMQGIVRTVLQHAICHMANGFRVAKRHW